MKIFDGFSLIIIALFVFNLLTFEFKNPHWMDITSLVLSFIALTITIINLFLRWRVNRED